MQLDTRLSSRRAHSLTSKQFSHTQIVSWTKTFNSLPLSGSRFLIVACKRLRIFKLLGTQLKKDHSRVLKLMDVARGRITRAKQESRGHSHSLCKLNLASQRIDTGLISKDRSQVLPLRTKYSLDASKRTCALPTTAGTTARKSSKLSRHSYSLSKTGVSYYKQRVASSA